MTYASNVGRQDRRRLIGCNVGDVGVRGCGRGCCPYNDEDIFDETHLQLSSSPYCPSETFHPTDLEVQDRIDNGRTGLRWNNCGGYHYRPKFACLDCRRVFRPFYDDTKLEFETGRQGWRVRVRPEHNTLLRNAKGRALPVRKSKSDTARVNELIARLEQTETSDGGAWNRGIDLWHRTQRDPQRLPQSSPIHTPQSSVDGDALEPLSNEELIELLSKEPDLWWQSISTFGNNHKKSCPTCGKKAIRVGSTFGPPRRQDKEAWLQVAEMHANGADLGACFSYCATFDEYNEMALEAQRLANRKAHADAWDREKHRRLVALGLVCQTKCCPAPAKSGCTNAS